MESLFISGNLISALPKAMEKLKNLKELDASHNLIQVSTVHSTKKAF